MKTFGFSRIRGRHRFNPSGILVTYTASFKSKYTSSKAGHGWPSIGYNLPTPAAAPLAYLTASIFNWDIFYKNAVLQILDKKWKPSFYWCDLNSGVVDLDELSSLCAPSTKDYIEDYKTRMKKGLFEPFTGPIWDQYGLKLISEKQELTEEEIWNMNWFVKGVDSSNAKTF